ncbi:MAG: rhomboid family intramembrane serine protease [Acidimicrobiales bacterium]
MNRPSAPLRAAGTRAPGPFVLLAVTVATMWIAEGADQAVFDQQLDQAGVVPRELDGLPGIVWAPFLHYGFAHLVANTVPLLVLGGLVAIKGATRFLQVTLGVILLGGLGTWLFGRDGVHLGASGVVFGYFGYLVAAALLERRLRSIVLGLIALVLYGGLVWGAVPTTAPVSWEGHLSGLLAGVYMAWSVTRRRRRRSRSHL